MPLKLIARAVTSAASTDSYTWSNPAGGDWDTGSNWTDVTTAMVAVIPPASTNAVAIIGGSGTFTNITGSGAASSLSISNRVILWGTVTVGGAVTLAAPVGLAAIPPDLELDGGASLIAGRLAISDGTLQAGNGSTVSISGGAVVNQTFVLAVNGGGLSFGTLTANDIYNGGNVYSTPLIAVDDSAYVHVGAQTASALGALTIDSGHVATISGAIDATVVLNGTLAVQAGHTLTINGINPFGSPVSVSGTGALVINESSTLILGIPDSAAIQFAAPGGTLVASAIPTGTITGFRSGEVIELLSSATSPATSIATGVSYQQLTVNTGKLTLSKGGRAVGTLAVAGSYITSAFHLSLDTQGNDFITVQPIGGSVVEPSVITGSAGSDTLYATASQQTLTGLGGNDILRTSNFSGITFKDIAANLDGSVIQAFDTTDKIDLTDLRFATATITYLAGLAPGYLVSDGTVSATLAIGFSGAQPAGYFTAATDGAAGTVLRYTSVNTDSLSFTPAAIGVYAQAANWRDATTGLALAPGYGNAVSITGGATFTGVTGSGFAASLQTGGNVLIRGSLNVGSVVSGVSGALTQNGTLALEAGGTISLAGSATIGGFIEVGAGGMLTAGGTLRFSAYGAGLMAIGGGSARFAQGLVTGTLPSVISVDTTSVIEFGAAGHALAGALTIDSGITAALRGTIGGNVVVNGALLVNQGASLSIQAFGTTSPAVTGLGTITLANAATLAIAGADSATIAFSPVVGSSTAPETLILNGTVPTGTITGFAKGDIITLARPVTSVTYTQVNGSGGVLTLFNAGTAVGTLALSGSFTASQFLLTPSANAQSTSITYLPAPVTGIGNQVSDNSHTYGWASATGGDWSNPANWIDATYGATPMVAPSLGNPVNLPSVQGGINAAQIVSGIGLASSVEVGMDAVFTGTLTVANAFEVQGYRSEAWLEAGALINVGALHDYSMLSAVGGGTLIATGLTGSNLVAGTLTATGGGAVWLAGGGLTISGGTIAVDGVSSLKVGNTGGVTAGVFSIDSGQTVVANAGALIDANMLLNGVLSLAYASATIEGFGGVAGSIRGNGTISLQSETLLLNAADTAAIAFASGFSILELKGPLPTGVIQGFAAGDIIRVDRTVTGVSFSQTSVAQGTLTLTNGGVLVGSLTLAGNFAGSFFQADVTPSTGAVTISLQAAPGVASSPAPAATNADAYAWTGSSGGAWAVAGNWMDTTAGAAASKMPGSGNAVTIAGNIASAQYTAIGGNASVANLSMTGGVLLSGQVSVASKLSLLIASATQAELVLAAGARMTAATAIVNGRIEVTGGAVTITGGTTLTAGSLLSLRGGTIQLAGLIGNGTGNLIAVDANSVIKIGNFTSAVAGALSAVAGSNVALNGAIFGNVVANGTISVPGGGALFIDLNAGVLTDPYASVPTIGGSGTLVIAQNGTLGLGVSASPTIQFSGPGATLALAALPSGTIKGFAYGNQIQVNQCVTAISYSQSGSAGVLTLQSGTAAIGTLQFSGTYGSVNAFHLDSAANGSMATITLQSLGAAPVQPTLIKGTLAHDLLTATAAGQTMTGLAGGDMLDGAGLSGIVFSDTTSNLNACTIQGFVTSDAVGFTDLIPGSAWVKFAAGKISISDGTHSANFMLAFATPPASGAFHIASDGATGGRLTWY